MFKKSLSLILSLLLTVSIAVTILSGCNDSPDTSDVSSSTAVSQSSVIEIGSGEKSFTFAATSDNEITTTWLVRTDAETVGAALLEKYLISGEESTYGLMVKTVNGVTADFNADGAYWAFYIDGEFASTGVDATPIEEGKAYSFVYTKG